MGLNENQLRTVTVTLRLLEQRLEDIERVAQQDVEGILYYRHAQFTPQQIRRIRQLIALMREEIRRAANQFQLPVEEVNVVRYIIGTLVLSWESLEESRPRKLKAYGDVDPALQDTLDPILRRLIQLLFTLEDAVRKDDQMNSIEEPYPFSESSDSDGTSPEH